MRSADITTVSRVVIAVAVVFGLLARLNAILLISGIVLERVLDGLDGYFALYDMSDRKLGFISYVNASVFGDKKLEPQIKKWKGMLKNAAPHGARFDVAGDRATEYIYWFAFTYLGLVPLFVTIIVIIRHSFVDALMGAKGTSSKMKTKFARMVYSSNFARAFINVPKVVTFSYLVLVYLYGWPLWIGYVFIAVLVFNILLRGAAEAYENLA